VDQVIGPIASQSRRSTDRSESDLERITRPVRLGHMTESFIAVNVGADCGHSMVCQSQQERDDFGVPP